MPHRKGHTINDLYCHWYNWSIKEKLEHVFQFIAILMIASSLSTMFIYVFETWIKTLF